MVFAQQAVIIYPPKCREKALFLPFRMVEEGIGLNGKGSGKKKHAEKACLLQRWPRQGSNLDFRFRKPTHYPLYYEAIVLRNIVKFSERAHVRAFPVAPPGLEPGFKV